MEWYDYSRIPKQTNIKQTEHDKNTILHIVAWKNRITLKRYLQMLRGHSGLVVSAWFVCAAKFITTATAVYSLDWTNTCIMYIQTYNEKDQQAIHKCDQCQHNATHCWRIHCTYTMSQLKHGKTSNPFNHLKQKYISF